VPPATMFQKLKNTAYKPGGGGGTWSPDFGHGIIRPVDAYNQLP
jgi:hypothetical protein